MKTDINRTQALALCVATLSAFAFSAPVTAALPAPVVEMRFSEGTGQASANSGTLGGSAAFVLADELPMFTNNVPTGPYAPGDNSSSLDFGVIAAGQGGRAADLTTLNGDGTLGALNAFTIAGWLNARSLNEGFGGNRIAFALASGNGPGLDLVQTANGAIRIGINQWPDGANGGGPASAPGVLKADPQASLTNWIFFSITYDPALESENLKYYFGSATALASLSSAHNYKGGLDNGGIIESSGFLTFGNFSDVIAARYQTGPSGGSRNFRGLMDEFRIYDTALTLPEVQQAQLNGELPVVPVTFVTQPANQTVFAGQSSTFRVQASGTAPFTYQWQRNGTNIPGATESSYTISSTALTDDTASFRVRVSNSATPAGALSEAATLTVLPENGHKVSLSFSDGGPIVTNLGNLGGNGLFTVRDGFPVVSVNVPAGAFAPPTNSTSLDFGAIIAGQGGRAVDLTNRIDNTLGPMTAFTVTGWLNSRDLTEGFGGNRIAFALASPNGPGFDLVHNSAGALRLGVNQWPDAGAGGPLSSEGKLIADPETAAANWVFFAVTYDSSLEFGQVSYYFGNGTQAAELDITADYLQGPIVQSGALTIGNFGTVAGARNETGPAGGSRVFRGLIDEVNVFNKALSLAEIQAIQKAPAYTPAIINPPAIPALEPANVTTFAGYSATFRVNVTGTPPLSYQWWRRDGGVEAAIPGATEASYTIPTTAIADSGDEFWVVVTNSGNTTTSRRALLTVLADENNQRVSLSFSEGSGTTTVNLGNVGGTATMVVSNGFPAFAQTVPSGPFAPTNNASSIDFGVIGDTEGGRALDLNPSVTPTIGPLQGFTLTGWLNSRDLRHGFGGNRILYSQTTPGVGGFDLVQEAGGVLWVGVNQWPDAQPNSPAKSITAIPEDPAAGPDNWVFFAFTYDGTMEFQNASFYFGSPSQAAALDSTVDYNRGPISNMGQLTVGNFSVADNGARNGTGPSGGSRVFRGLIDEINVFSKVLTLEEIQAVQKAAPRTPAETASLSVVLENNQLVISWSSSGNFQLEKRSSLSPAGTWTDEPTSPVVSGNLKTVTLPTSESAMFFRLIRR